MWSNINPNRVTKNTVDFILIELLLVILFLKRISSNIYTKGSQGIICCLTQLFVVIAE